jgi:hypothetical protein
MRRSRLLLAVGSLCTLLWAVSGKAHDIDSIAGMNDGPALSGPAQRYAEDGYRDRSVVNGAKADDHSLGFSEAGGDDRNLNFRMDPISGALSGGPSGH